MFNFQRLNVYQKDKSTNNQILHLIKSTQNLDSFISDQLKRASISSVINIAEGSGRFSKKDKRHFYIIARGSIYESISLIEIMNDLNIINNSLAKRLFNQYEEIIKMLCSMIKKLEQPN